MRVVYGVQFEVRGPEATPDQDVPSIVKKKVADWVADWYKRRRSMDIVFPMEWRGLTPLEGLSRRHRTRFEGGREGRVDVLADARSPGLLPQVRLQRDELP